MKTVYHASPYKYDFPDYENLLKGLRLGDRHFNGALGLWCAIKNDWIVGFGKNMYKIDFDDSNQKMISAYDFACMCKKREKESDYVDWRNELISKGYTVLALVEKNDEIEMLIILDFNAIKNFIKIK